jgi:hypothetical protein
MKPKLLLGLALVLSGGWLTALPTNAADTNLLRVVVIPSKTEVRVKETFKVALRVENPTTTNQTVRVWSCSWDEEWKSSNTNISWLGWICTRNVARNVEIPPGGAYTNELEMLIPEPIPENSLSFRMGFTPIDSEKTLWSDGVKLNILPSGKGEATNSFGIYLTVEAVDRRITGYGQGNWSHIRLLESPLISATDIISYNFMEHSMRLRPEALAKIPRPPVEGTPFIVVANGQRIYLGVFVTSISSMSFAVPTIVVDRQALVTNQRPDTLVIQRAYPQPSFGIGPDPRGDQRVKTVLNTLHKLKSEHP